MNNEVSDPSAASCSKEAPVRARGDARARAVPHLIEQKPSLIRGAVRALFDSAQRRFDSAFGAEANPFNQLGALGWFFYWIVAVSGIYLYAFFDTGVTQAYDSVEWLTHEQWYAGGIMRSLHRYASDALVVVALLHLTREWANARLRGPRWFGWFTGVLLLWFIFAAGITGYWVVWDRLAQYIALSTSEWLDSLGLFAQSITRNFIHESTLSGRFFTLMAFIHIAVPLIMLFVMWLHIQRHSRPGVNPPRRLALGCLLALLALSVVYPATSQGPAVLSKVPGRVGLDWFYLAPLPVQDHLGGIATWLVVGIGTLLLVALPWLPPRATRAAARVNLDACNGCGRCVADCPYGAVSMRPRTDSAPFTQEAVVSSNLCVGCGLCTGACPTASPFSRRRALVAGIEQPAQPVAQLRQQCLDKVAMLDGNSRVLVLGCSHGTSIEALEQAAEVAVLRLPCIGMLPPAFVDLLIMRGHVDGVFLTGCREGACHDRFGIRWTRDRVAGARDPYLRKRVPLDRLCMFFGGRAANAETRVQLDEFRAQLAHLPPLGASRRASGEPQAQTDA